MLLGIRFLDNYVNPNVYQTPSDYLSFTEGDTKTIVFQLIDKSNDVSNIPPGRTYITAATTITFIIQNINTALKLTKVATNVANTPYWQVNLASGEIVGGTYSVKVSLTDSGNVLNAYANSVIKIFPSTTLT
jgi:hypothetical protein